jgi:hypothetical protein
LIRIIGIFNKSKNANLYAEGAKNRDIQKGLVFRKENWYAIFV